MAKLHDIYRQEVIKTLTEQFGYKTVMQVPRIEKITLNMGVGEAVADKKVLENLRFVKAIRSVVRLHYVANVCGNSLKD